MGVISEYLRVVLTAAAPISTPSLTKLVILGTTRGKSNTVRDQLMVYTGTTALAGDFDPADEEYRLGQTIFAQGSVLQAPRDIYVFNGTRTDYRLGTINTGSQVSNNALTWTADKYGDFGDRVSFEVVQGKASAATGIASIDQTLVVGSTVTNSAVEFTQAKDVETIVRVQFVDPQLPNQQLSIVVENQQGLVPAVNNGYRTLQNIYDYTIKFNLATDFTENITTTAQDIIDAITLPIDPAYNALASLVLDAGLPIHRLMVLA